MKRKQRAKNPLNEKLNNRDKNTVTKKEGMKNDEIEIFLGRLETGRTEDGNGQFCLVLFWFFSDLHLNSSETHIKIYMFIFLWFEVSHLVQIDVFV